MKMEESSFETKQKISQLSQAGQQRIEQGAPENAVDCFLNAYQLSRQVGDDNLERTCALNLGAAYIESGNAPEGLKLLHKATPPDGEKDGTSNGDLFYNIALGHEALKNSKESVKYYWLASGEFRTDPEMQLQCLTKCAQLYTQWKQYAKVVEVYEHLCNVYKTHDNSVMQASCLCEIATNHRFAQNDEASSRAANEAYEVLKRVSESEDNAQRRGHLAGKLFNDLGLVYTQLQNYDMACSCFEHALPLVRSPSENKQLEAVILQNLGAAYNFRGEYQRAIKFHEDAADAYAKLRSRNSQGQCFTNLAFAYSQLGNIDEADVAFNHALLASKDAGDKQTRWQALEGLGCVKFNQGKYEKAERFFLDALRLIPESNDEASDRVRQKLSRVMEMKFTAGRQPFQRQSQLVHTQSHMSAISTERLQNIEGQIIEEPRIIPEHASMQSAAPMPTGEQPLMSSARQVEERQQAIPDAPRPRRIIGMRKKDSIGHKHYPKMMRGLSGTASSMSNYDSPRYVMHGTDRSSGKLDDVEESSSSEDSSSGSEEGSSESESEEDRKDGESRQEQQEVKNEVMSPVIEEIFRPSESLQKSSSPGQVRKTDKEVDHRQYEKMLLEKEENEDKSSSDESSDEDSDDESSSSSGDESKPESSDDEDDDGKEKQKNDAKETVAKARTPPPQSPPHTSGFSTGDVDTYIKPLKTQGKAYGTDDMTPYLDSGVVPAFYDTGYTPVPYDDVPGAFQYDSGPDNKVKNHEGDITVSQGECNLPLSSSGDPDDPKTLYSTVDKANKNKEPVRWFQDSESGTPEIRVERPQKQRKERGGNFFESDQSLSGEDIDITQKMKEVASNMSLRGSIRPQSGDEEDPYNSIKDVTRGTGDFQYLPGEEENRLKRLNEMPRGQREVILSREHLRRSELGPPLPERGKHEKDSRTCSVM